MTQEFRNEYMGRPVPFPPVVYISGPMSGYEDLNFPAFFAAEKRLQALGFDTINPAALPQPEKTWKACMRVDIAAMMKADSVVTLPGWEASKGASIEVNLAKSLNMLIWPLEHILIIFRQDAAASVEEGDEQSA